jgi:hexulose-6-phosphate isomerase
MKKAINTWSFPGNWSIDERLKVAAEAGFEGFEPDISVSGPVNLDSVSTDLLDLRKKIVSYGLEISGLASGMYWDNNPVSDDSGVRAMADRILQRQLECAHELEVNAILVVPGTVGADFLPDAPPVRYDLAYERAQAFIERALPLAEKLGVTIGLENVWNKFLMSPLELRQFIDSFDSPRVRSYLDVGNVVASGYPEHWVEILSHRIVRVHVKDYRRVVGSINGFVDLLSGDVNWPEVVGALRSVGYDGWVAAEMVPPVPFYRYSPQTLLHNTSRAMSDIFGL